MKNRFPQVNPVIDTDWGERNRDIVAFGRCKVQEMLRDGYDPRRGPARDLADSIEDFTRDGLPLSNDILNDYANASGATIQTSRETSASKQQVASDPNENDDLIDDMKNYAREFYFGAAHVKKWNQALAALGVETGERPMTFAEADDNLRRFNKKRWQPVVDAIRKRSGVPDDGGSEDSLLDKRVTFETYGTGKDGEPYQYGIDITNAVDETIAEGNFEWMSYLDAEMAFMMSGSGYYPKFPVERSVCEAIKNRFPKVYMRNMLEWAKHTQK